MKGTFLFLGTSASSGVPMIGCRCSVCKSKSPFNKRKRPSGLIKTQGKKILIDAGPDLHAQAIQYGIDHLEGLILTHTHYDHIAGIDELRVFFIKTEKPVPCLLSKESYSDLQKRYDYLFKNKATLSAKFDFDVLEHDQGKKEFLGLPIQYCSYMQGDMLVKGYRLGDFAYISDIKDYDSSIIDFLKGVRTLVIGALKPEPSPIHLSFSEAVEIAKKTGAEKTWITHLGHTVDHEAGNALLPPEVRLAFDGLELEFEYA